ncbi:MAG: 23S rRNA (adenine(2030)-N(6))-methyltransferase RlmJ [Rhizomicrobium sp.]|nr:23S rRNA (adenine(2030)-N(6))-methyltransferase RlmJ [Rhizomicrobium sp.]
MNYRHAFHAGNFADVAKHLALVAILQHLAKKPAGFVVIDTHAGSGSYDLSSAEARRTGEAVTGVMCLDGLLGGNDVLTTYLSLANDEKRYPGSPLIAAKLLRPQDRLVAIEKHPEERAALTATLRPFLRARAEEGDGYRRLLALLPPPERRGLVLIDPPYESPAEFTEAAKAFAAAYRRFATGTYMIWFPIKSAAEANGFCGEVMASGATKLLRLDVRLASAGEGKLSAAGLLIVNPPWQLQSVLADALALVAPRLGAEVHFEAVGEAAE